jgi:hypothetical protein
MEPDRAHANKCALTILCLRDYFPQDVIGLIVTICWDLRSRPILAFLTDSAYAHVAHDNWKVMKQNVFKLHPDLKLRHMNCRSLHRRMKDKSSVEYHHASLFIPGWVWDEIMIDYHCVDSDEIPCEFIEIEIASADLEIARMEYPKMYLCRATMYCNTMLTPVSNIACMSLSMYDCSPQVNLFMNIQNKVAF